jgi:hypothetical protein
MIDQKQRRRARVFRDARSSDNNRILDHRIQELSQLNHCRFLATRAFSFFREHYDFSPSAIGELQSILDTQFDKIPYGWQISQIETGITRIIETFIRDRNIHRYGADHIPI